MSAEAEFQHGCKNMLMLVALYTVISLLRTL